MKVGCRDMKSIKPNKPNVSMKPREPVVGIEPTTTVLPRLCATTAPHGPSAKKKNFLVGSGGFEPPKLSQLIYSQSHLATLVTAQITDTHEFVLSDRRDTL